MLRHILTVFSLKEGLAYYGGTMLICIFLHFFINSHAKHTTTYMHVNQLKQRLDETNKIHSLEKKKGLMVRVC